MSGYRGASGALVALTLMAGAPVRYVHSFFPHRSLELSDDSAFLAREPSRWVGEDLRSWPHAGILPVEGSAP